MQSQTQTQSRVLTMSQSLTQSQGMTQLQIKTQSCIMTQIPMWTPYQKGGQVGPENPQIAWASGFYIHKLCGFRLWMMIPVLVDSSQLIRNCFFQLEVFNESDLSILDILFILAVNVFQLHPLIICSF